MIHVKEEIAVTEETHLMEENVEILWCRLASSKILLGVCYNSSSNSVAEQEKIYKNIEKVCSQLCNKEAMICGDFNHKSIDWEELEARAEDVAFLNLTQDLGLTQHVTEPTREDNILDLVLTTNPALVSNTTVSEPFGTSDHRIVEFDLTCTTNYTDWKEKYYDYRNGDYKAMRQYLQDLDISTLLNKDDYSVEDIWKILTNIIHEAVRKFVPIKTRRNRGKTSKPLWWNRDIYKARRNRLRWWNRYKESKLHEDYLKYQSAQRKAAKLILKTGKAKIRKENNRQHQN